MKRLLQLEETTPLVNEGKLTVLYRERNELLAQEPPLDEIDHLCMEAWNRLDAERPIGMAVESIPPTAVLSWAEFKALDRPLTQLLLDVVHILDCERARKAASERALAGINGGKS